MRHRAVASTPQRHSRRLQLLSRKQQRQREAQARKAQRRAQPATGQGARRAASGRGRALRRPPARPPVRRKFADPKAAPMRMRKYVRALLQDGLCHLPKGLTLEQVDLCRRTIFKVFHQNIEAITRLDLVEELNRNGFRHFKLRQFGRYDMEIEEFKNPEFAFLHSKEAPWYPLVAYMLGSDCRLAHCGVMLSMPGSHTQNWHSDGDHLSSKTYLPAHCLNVFIPLCDITTLNGGTEMVPGSHFLNKYDDPTLSPQTILANAGECIFFDFRLRHRGLGNDDVVPRPLLYLQYCIPSFSDTMNFSAKRYLSLPTVPRMSLPSAPKASASVRRSLMEDQQKELKKPNQEEHDGEAQAASDDEDADAAPRMTRGRARHWECHSPDSDNGSGDNDEPEDWVDFLAVQREQLEEERARLKQKPKKDIETVRELRAQHRELAMHAPRVNRVPLYKGSPVIVRDAKSKKWYLGAIVKFDVEKRQALVHFLGWSTRHDRKLPITREWLRPAPADILLVSHNHDQSPQAVNPNNPTKGITTM